MTRDSIFPPGRFVFRRTPMRNVAVRATERNGAKTGCAISRSIRVSGRATLGVDCRRRRLAGIVGSFEFVERLFEGIEDELGLL